VRFIVGGDSRDDSAHVIPWAFAEAKARGAAVFLFLGDMELTPEIDKTFARELALLDPIPFYPVLGNHEVEQMGFLAIDKRVAERTLARRFLGTPRTPVRSALGDRIVYSVDLPGGVHFIALDNVTQNGFGHDQLEWLATDLGRARADGATKHILVGMHKPLAHNGVATHGMDHDGPVATADSEAALALFVKEHVDMILASHVHQFTQFQQAGIPSYITGGLGAPLRRSGPEHAFHHFLQLDIDDAAIHVEVVRFGGTPAIEHQDDEDD
jgi:3',5'-cyclic AMP phosphodiesterase CpdA